MIAAALGWVATLGTLSAYVLLVRGRLNSTSLRYASMNAAGGVLGGIAAIFYHAWPSMASNFVWAALALHTIAMTLWTRRRELAAAVVLRPAMELVDDQPTLELAS